MSIFSKELVKEIDLGLTWEPNAPIPCLLQSEHKAFLLFYMEEPDDIGVLEWLECWGALLGPPGEETRHGHPLHKHGLADTLWAGEVLNSEWIDRLRRIDSIHHRHDPTRIDRLKHYILKFHDSTFECVASGFTSSVTQESMSSAVERLCSRLNGR